MRSSLEVSVRGSLADPGPPFGGLAGVDGWKGSASGRYQLAGSHSEIAAPVVARALVGAGADILSIAESHHSLEDFYLQLVDEDVEASRR